MLTVIIRPLQIIMHDAWSKCIFNSHDSGNIISIIHSLSRQVHFLPIKYTGQP